MSFKYFPPLVITLLGAILLGEIAHSVIDLSCFGCPAEQRALNIELAAGSILLLTGTIWGAMVSKRIATWIVPVTVVLLLAGVYVYLFMPTTYP